MHCLVTGSSGFIGSHLVPVLLKQGHQVTGIDINKPSLTDPDFNFIQHNVREPFLVKDTIDVILNFASPASPLDYQQRPLDTLLTNINGTHNMLELAKTHDARLIQASTSEVYGEPAVHPQREDYNGNVNPIGPRACYDEGKRAAETLCAIYKQSGSSVTIIRLFNIYGPGMRIGDGRVIPTFVYQALNNLPLTVNGDGSQTRSFCYVSDLMIGLLAILNTEFNGVVNLGNPTEVTITQIATIIQDLTNNQSALRMCAMPTDDPTRRKPDITVAKSKFGWEPKIELREGLGYTIAAMAKELDLPWSNQLLKSNR